MRRLTGYMHHMHIGRMSSTGKHTPLERWMKAEGLRDQWLVEAVGITQPQASRIRRGKSRPSLEVAVAIERLTRGKVRPRDMLVPATEPKAANDDAPASEAA